MINPTTTGDAPRCNAESDTTTRLPKTLVLVNAASRTTRTSFNDRVSQLWEGEEAEQYQKPDDASAWQSSERNHGLRLREASQCRAPPMQSPDASSAQSRSFPP